MKFPSLVQFLLAAALSWFIERLPAHAAWDIILNDGFEFPALPANTYLTTRPGGEPAGFAWKVASGDIDRARLPLEPFVLYGACQGGQGIDLNGAQRGAIYQDFCTLPGESYNLQFAFADNPVEGGISSADLAVIDLTSASSLASYSASHSTSTNSPPNADSVLLSTGFIATGLVTRLGFMSTSASNSPSGGIILDAVEVRGFTADFDADIDVDGADFLLWQRGEGIFSDALRSQGDIGDDGRVNGNDLAKWKTVFGAAAPAVKPIPEPTACGLAILALLLPFPPPRKLF